MVLAAGNRTRIARAALALGCAAGIAGVVAALPLGSRNWQLPVHLADVAVAFHLSPSALWLLLFGLIPALLSCALGSPATAGARRGVWLLGAALSLLGALGVFGLQDTMSFLIAWELMSLGGGIMLMAENSSPRSSQATLFMLSLLETGAVALLLAFLLLGRHGGPEFAALARGPLASGADCGIGLLLLAGFGAKLGLLPFYEWFPGAYGSGSGATGAIFSGVVLNAAYFGLARGLIDWLPGAGRWVVVLGGVVLGVAVLSAILASLYAFQQQDWRRLLSFSTAENAAVAVSLLGAALLFRAYGQSSLAALAGLVALIQMAAHSLAKGALFLTADGVYAATSSYAIRQRGILRSAPVVLGVGAVFAAMSLAAMPPQAGFVSEWYVFQTMFQAFHLPTLFGRIALALAGAGLALTAAVALATMVKLFGVGLLGGGSRHRLGRISGARAAAIFILGGGVLALAVGMPWWLQGLRQASLASFGVNAAAAMRSGWILVPLTGSFAFISPTLLVIVGPLLALLPLGLLLNARRYRVTRVPIWYGGLSEDPARVATTALTFSNALRTIYGFVYHPTHNVAREYHQRPYLVKRLIFTHDVAPIFGPHLFAPIVRAVRGAARSIRGLQSGYLNLYTGVIGLLLLIILIVTMLR